MSYEWCFCISSYCFSVEEKEANSTIQPQNSLDPACWIIWFLSCLFYLLSSMESDEVSNVEDDKGALPDEENNMESNELQSEIDPEKEESKDINDVENTESLDLSAEDNTGDSEINAQNSPEEIPVPVKTPGRRGRKKRAKIYNEDDDPDVLKEKKKKRAVELKLRSLKCKYRYCFIANIYNFLMFSILIWIAWNGTLIYKGYNWKT